MGAPFDKRYTHYKLFMANKLYDFKLCPVLVEQGVGGIRLYLKRWSNIPHGIIENFNVSNCCD